MEQLRSIAVNVRIETNKDSYASDLELAEDETIGELLERIDQFVRSSVD